MLGEVFINIDYLLIGGVVAVAGWICFMMYWTDIKKWAPEAPIFKKCRKNNIPIIEVVSGGKLGYFAGEKEMKGNLSFKDNTYGLFIDPRILGQVPALIGKGGLQFLHFNTKFPFPVSPGASSALTTIRDFVREHHPELGFLDDLVLIQLISTDRGDMDYDVERIISRMDTVMDAEAVVMSIVQVQEETSQILCTDGIVAFEEGIQLNPSVLLSQEVSSMINIVRAQVMAEHDQQLMDVMKYAGALMMVLIGVGVFLKIGGFV